MWALMRTMPIMPPLQLNLQVVCVSLLDVGWRIWVVVPIRTDVAMSFFMLIVSRTCY